MAGRIRDEDIAEVREKAPIADVVSEYVTLRRAGGGSLKGLCPFHDEKSPSFHVTPSRNFYHCLAGETGVITDRGTLPIAELAGSTHRVLGARGHWVEAPFRSYGVQRLMRIVVTRNRQRKELFATDGHRWFVRSGKALRGRRETLTRDLKPGDSLAYTYPRKRVTRTTPSLPRFFKEWPSLDESVSYLYGWLAGYFAADGCVSSDGTVMLNSANRDNLEFVRSVCTRLGIGTFGVTTQMREGFEGREKSALHRVHLVNEDLTSEFFIIPRHRERFDSAQKAYVRRGWVVESVEWSDRVEEVFCAEVPVEHAFVLEDNILTGNCFGCQEGGDVISFVMKIDGLSFTDTVESLAAKYGVTLRYDEGGAPTPQQRRESGLRPRLIEANRAAQEFYADQLGTPVAMPARQFLSERGFDREAAEHFGIGFAPRDGEALWRHLRQKGFRDEELVTAGLVAQGRSLYDRFRGRLLWPIRDTSGATIGFGARRIFDDDRIEAKYLNTPETPLYKKSQVLYGIDLARREIARSSQAVVVEGYTDVMACHLAGVPTAVATCGTAFGADHGRVLRRLLHDHEEFRGEVIFTFDGDEAGQKAALRAFEGDQQFVAQTYVAVEPTGLDPCDLRLRDGDAAVRELVARRMPLYRFVLGNVISKFDLDRADGRIDAVREAAKLVASVRDQSKVVAFAQELSRMVGADVDTNQVVAEVRRAQRRGPAPAPPESRRTTPGAPAPQPVALPDPRDPRLKIERETLKLVIQAPEAVGRSARDVDADDFTHPLYRAVWELVASAGGPTAADEQWAQRLRDRAADPSVAALLSALAVEGMLSRGEPDHAYAVQHVLRLQELTTLRRIADLKSKLQRTNPVDQAGDYNRMFGELVALEKTRRALLDQLVGGE